MNLLIVDDELSTRKSIVRILNDLGYYEIREARDGNEALRAILQSMPQAVIADIRMPEMDGMELLAKVKELSEDIFFIILSGYDLFEYAQKALSLGAYGYLLKPVNKDELINVLGRIEEKLFRESSQVDQISLLKAKMDHGMKIARSHFIMGLLRQQFHSEKYVLGKLQELELFFEEKAYCVMLIYAETMFAQPSEVFQGDPTRIRSIIENISLDIFNSKKINACIFEDNEHLGFLMNFKQDPEKICLSNIYDACSQIIKNINDSLCYSATIGIGTVADELFSLGDSYEAALRSCMHRLSNGTNQVFVSSSETNLIPENASLISTKTEQELLIAFEKADRITTMQCIEEIYLCFFEPDTFSKNCFMKLNFNLIMLLFKLLSQIGMNPDELLGEEFKLYNELNACSSISNVLNWYKEKLNICFDAIDHSVEKINSKKILKSKEYIHANYQKDITLEAVADHIRLNSSYFSRLFKQVTNENFVDYVIQYRIRKAKELLKEGIYKCNEVSRMVGFHDEKYFYKVFKKYSGLTPSEFKSK